MNRRRFFFLSLFLILTLHAVSDVEFESWSDDITNPYFSAWKPGFISQLYGTDPFTGVTSWIQYDVDSATTLGDVNCIRVHYTSSAGDNYYFYIAQDTDGNIRYLKEDDESFLSDPPIFFPDDLSNGSTWAVEYFTWRHRFTVAYIDDYEENDYGYGPYEDAVYIRHYYDGALLGTIAAAKRWGFVLHDGRDLYSLDKAALGTLEGVVSDAWNGEILSGVSVVLDGSAPRSMTTGSDGYYRFRDLPNLNYQVQCSLSEYEDYASYVTPQLSAVTEKNILMTPLSGTITGVITDNLSGEPIQDATVQLDWYEDTRVSTSETGEYTLNNVRIGSHTVYAWGQLHNLDSRECEVSDDEQLVIDFALSSITGSVQGTLRHMDTAVPISGATVTLNGDEDMSTTSDGNGFFRIEDITPGTHYLQADAEGFLFYQKRIGVNSNEDLNLGDVYLTPTSALTPAGTDFDFEEGPEGWRFRSTDEFDAPEGTSSEGRLGVSPGDSTTAFGYWESPFIAFEPGKTYRARFTISSDQTDPAKAPTARLRVNSGNNQCIFMQSINSLGNGDYSPTTQPSSYDVLFTPPLSSASEGFTICFDIVNIGSEDNPEAWIYLEDIRLEAVAVTPE